MYVHMFIHKAMLLAVHVFVCGCIFHLLCNLSCFTLYCTPTSLTFLLLFHCMHSQLVTSTTLPSSKPSTMNTLLKSLRWNKLEGTALGTNEGVEVGRECVSRWMCTCWWTAQGSENMWTSTESRWGEGKGRGGEEGEGKWNELYMQWNLGNKTTIRAMKSGLIFEVVLILRAIIHVYMDLGLNQSGLISKVVV